MTKNYFTSISIYIIMLIIWMDKVNYGTCLNDIFGNILELVYCFIYI